MDLDQVDARAFKRSLISQVDFDGYRLAFNKLNTRVESAGHANIVKRSGDVVEGVVFELSSSPERNCSNGSIRGRSHSLPSGDR